MREKKNTRRKKQNIKIHTLAARRASELRERERVYTTNISRHIINIIKRHVLYRLIKTRIDLYFCVFHQFLMSQRYFQKRRQKLFLGSLRSVGRSVGRSISGRKKNHHHEQRSYSGKTDEFVRGRFRRRRARDVLVLVLYSREKLDIYDVKGFTRRA